MHEPLIQTIKATVAQIKRQPALADELTHQANLIEEVGLDSLEMLQFMLELESRINRRIDFDRLEYSMFFSLDTLAEFLAQMPERA
jgi:acyl carrier protein